MAQHDTTAELPQVRSWWVTAVIGVGVAVGLAAAASAESLANVSALEPIRQGIGPYNQWALLAGIAALAGLVVLLIVDVWILEKHVAAIHGFTPPILPSEGWVRRAYEHCRAMASVGGRTTIDEIRQKIRARHDEYRHALSGGWLFKYVLLAFVIPTAGLCVAILNLRTAGPAFPVAEILWPVAGATLTVMMVLAVALLYCVRVKKSLHTWQEKTIATANRLVGGVLTESPTSSDPPSGPALRKPDRPISRTPVVQPAPIVHETDVDSDVEWQEAEEETMHDSRGSLPPPRHEPPGGRSRVPPSVPPPPTPPPPASPPPGGDDDWSKF